MRVVAVLAGLSLAMITGLSHADDSEAAIRQTLAKIQPDLTVEAIGESAMPGLYQVQLQNGRLLYASGDGQFLVQGYLFQMQNGKPVNLTEQHETKATAALLSKIPAEEMVIFPAKGETKAHITVFTDTDCGYCQKLHSEVPELNRRGVEVRYLAFPRQGVGSHGYNTLVSVWCAADRQAAMNKAKSREDLPKADCNNPVAKQYELGQAIGVSGTPAIVLADGTLIPGYQPAPDLAKLAIKAAKQDAK